MSRALGVVAGIGAGVCLSIGGIALRLVEEADGWQILAYRGAALGLAIFIWCGIKYGRRLPAVMMLMGRAGLLAALAIAFGAICYVFAILNTTVANTVVILSLAPLAAALLAWLVLREPVSRSTLGYLIVAVIGVVVMFADGLTTGGTLGMIIALGAVACFAIFIVSLRAGKDVDMIPAIGVSGLVTLAIAAVMAPGLAVSARDATIGIGLGVVQLAAGYVCLAVAARHIPAALVSVLVLCEVPLATLWVWWGAGEAPSLWASVGALIALIAVGAQAARGVRSG